MLAGRHRLLYRLKALLCAALILNINYWAGCGAKVFDSSRTIRIELSPDHPLTLELNNTAFGGAIALEVDPVANQFRLIYPETDRIIQGGFGDSSDGLALTNLATARRGKNTSMEINPKTKQVTRVISARGDEWHPDKVFSARELPSGLNGVDAYVAANPELMSLVVDPSKVDEILSISGKDNGSQLIIDPIVVLLAFLFQFCPGCLGYLVIFTIMQLIADIIFNILSQQPGDGDDGDGGSQPSPTPATGPPIARPDAASTPEETPVTIDVLANDEDADFGLAVGSVTVVLAAASGMTSVNPLTGAITYTPKLNFTGIDAFAYQVCDAGSPSECATAVVSINVTPVNDPPTAINDVGATFEDDPPLNLPFTALLANDIDVDLVTGDILTISNVTDSLSGAIVTINGTNVIYNHTGLFQSLAAGANTTDLFTYTVRDTAGATSTATVTMTITGRNDNPAAMDDEWAASADGPAVIQPASFFLANDTDIDIGDVLTIVSIDDTGTSGAVSLNGNMVTYDPGEAFLDLGGGQNATDTFTYTIDDGHGGQDTATVTVNIVGVNNPPVANDDQGEAIEDGEPVALATSFLLSNDSDPDAGDTLSVTGVTNSVAGSTVTLVEPDVIYDHTGLFQELGAGANTTDTFTYTIEDIQGATATATVTMTITGVNDVPVAQDDEGDASEDGGPVTLLSADILSNDSDIDIGDSIFISNVTDSTAGAIVSLVVDGIEYDPGELFQNLGAGANATDTFTYTIEDSQGATATATVTMNITGENDAPQAVDDMVEVLKQSPPLVIPIATLLSNDVDPDDADVLSLVSVTDSMAGATVTIMNDDVIYDFTGLFGDLGDEEMVSDTFTYTIEDTSGAQSTATVTVTINGSNDPPVVAKPSSITVDEDSQDNPLGIVAPTDPDVGDMLTITVTGLPDAQFGVVTLSDNTPVNLSDVLSESGLTGLQFDAAPDASGATGEFTYDVTDGLVTLSGGVTIEINSVADVPILSVTDAAGVVDEAIGLDITASLVDTDGSETLQITIANVPSDATLSAGTDNGGGSWTLAAGDLPGLTITAMTEGTIMLDVTATATESSNNDMASNMATLTVTVEAQNSPPIVDEPSNITVDEDSQDNPLGISAPTDPDVGDVLAITVTGLPDSQFGIVTLSDGTPVNVSDVLTESDLTDLQFDAAPDASGAAGNFAYEVSDGIETVSSSVTIDVGAIADAPNLMVSDASGVVDVAITLDITASLVDTDGSETLAITITGVPLDATLSAGTDNGGGSWTLSDTDLVGLTITAMTADTIMLEVTATATETSNSDMASTMATLTLTVVAENNPPMVAEPSSLIVDEDSQDNPLGIVAPTDTDVGDVLTITVTGLPDSLIGVATLSDGTPVSVSDVLTESDLTGLQFDTAADASGAAGSFAYDVSDGIDTVSGSVTIDVTAVADTPNLMTDDASGVTNESISLSIAASLVDTDGSETLEITVSNVPADATLSAGMDNGGGTWTLSEADLIGLSITAMTADTIVLDVTATATEISNNDMAQNMATLTVTVGAENSPPVVAEPSAINVDEDSMDNPIGIAAPTDPDVGDVLTITVTGLPDSQIGIVTLADGTPVSVSDELSESDLTGLQFDTAPDASGAAGAFTYDVSDGLATVGGSATIDVIAIADPPDIGVSDASGLTNAAIALTIVAQLVDMDGSETLEVVISNVPADASLSAGTDNGGGMWTLAPGDLAGLTITAMTADTIMLNVTATATETSNNDMASSAAVLNVTVTSQALTLFTESNDTVNFNLVSAGQFSKTDYYDALGGNDTVTLPDTGSGPSDFDKSITFFGGSGADTIIGGNRNDMIEGGPDNDMLFGGPGIDTLTGGDGDDVASGGLGSDFFFAGEGNDTYTSDSRLTGGLFTENGTDAFDGEADTDVLQLSGGGWTIIVMGVGTLTPANFVGGSFTQGGAAFGGMAMVTLAGSANPMQDGMHVIQFVNIEGIRLVDGSLK